jgi:predicted metallo-beta-lactamase superfamily hydrolase
MSYITIETQIDLDDYSHEIIYLFKNNKSFRVNLLQAMKDYDVIPVGHKHYDHDVRKQFTKIVDNYWKLTLEEEAVIKKIADRF